jgi:hypothetical protein
MMLDLTVKSVANRMPSSVAVKDPIWNRGLPPIENGIKNHRKRIKPLTRISRRQTFLSDKREKSTKRQEKKRADNSADHREHIAIRMENAATPTIFILGSRARIPKFLLMSASSNILIEFIVRDAEK